MKQFTFNIIYLPIGPGFGVDPWEKEVYAFTLEEAIVNFRKLSLVCAGATLLLVDRYEN